jgi:predicted nucleic acid-binding protein
MIAIDASIWVSRIVPQDTHHETSHHWLEERVASGSAIVVPILLLADVAGAISRRTGQPQLAEQAVSYLLRLSTLRIVPLDRRLGIEAARLASELSLRGADATYIALARYLGIPLFTWDQEQFSKGGRVVVVNMPSF